MAIKRPILSNYLKNQTQEEKSKEKKNPGKSPHFGPLTSGLQFGSNVVDLLDNVFGSGGSIGYIPHYSNTLMLMKYICNQAHIQPF